MITDVFPDGWIPGHVAEIRVPTHVPVSKKVQKPCNLNSYRNLHYHHLNNQKQNFSDIIKKRLEPLPNMKKVWLHYTIYAARRGRLDTMNVGSIVDKYFCDALVEAGKIPDDSNQEIIFTSFSFGGVSPVDGYAVVKIIELKPAKEREPMRILLDQQDVQAALDTYVQDMGISGATGVSLYVNDDDNVEAEVIINGSDDNQNQAPKKKKPGRPKGSKNKPKEPVNDAEANSSDDSDGANSGGSDASEANTETGPETTEATTEKANPFSEEETPFSEFEGKPEAEETTSSEPVTPKKKSSIFDA